MFYKYQESSPGSIALMSEPDLELLVDIDPEKQAAQHPRYSQNRFYCKYIYTYIHYIQLKYWKFNEL